MSGSDRYTGEPSAIVYHMTLRALQTLHDTDAGYATRSEEVNACQGKHGDCGPENYRKALRFLKDRYEQVKMAYYGGNKYVWYPASELNLPDAKEVSIRGETYTPAKAPR